MDCADNAGPGVITECSDGEAGFVAGAGAIVATGVVTTAGETAGADGGGETGAAVTGTDSTCVVDDVVDTVSGVTDVEFVIIGAVSTGAGVEGTGAGEADVGDGFEITCVEFVTIGAVSAGADIGAALAIKGIAFFIIGANREGVVAGAELAATGVFLTVFLPFTGVNAKEAGLVFIAIGVYFTRYAYTLGTISE